MKQHLSPIAIASLVLSLGPFGFTSSVFAGELSPVENDNIAETCQACQLEGAIVAEQTAFGLSPEFSGGDRANPENLEAQTQEATPENPPTAQQIEQRTSQLQQRLQVLQSNPLQQIYLGAPGTSSNTPTAYGGSLGSVGVGFSYQERTRYTDKNDGTAGLVFSLGNPQTAVGFDVGVTLLDLSDWGDRGSFNFKLHKALPQDFAVAVGIENALIWGFSDADTSTYAVGSKRFRLKESSQDPFSRLSVSLGFGNGRFRTEDQVQDDEGSIGVFGSVALQILPAASTFVEWTGQDLNLGASIAPFRDFPVVITPTLSDVTGTAGDGTRFTIGVGYGLSLF
ncbi:hypothetical protein [Oxynema aestuarii]|uniref:Uncharacterized protein n=1 Tax=Oxynema aestuarii AP17 TaxID=2064643 RepID=A0A6H1TSY8_9CYAN|nr:hypothetical protein [Oxynema aestuarii]QIZ69712.1 hypothetical protein HCG48_03225 [Oxynema aestuarii AP17]